MRLIFDRSTSTAVGVDASLLAISIGCNSMCGIYQRLDMTISMATQIFVGTGHLPKFY